jgi:hypothetical protein
MLSNIRQIFERIIVRLTFSHKTLAKMKIGTVIRVYNSHPWDSKKVTVVQEVAIV